MNANRNKRSVVIDLKQAAGRDACLAIAKSADVLVYNIRPQAMTRLRLSYDDVRAVNPRLIYVGAFGYSQRGPYAAKAAYDDLIQGATGLPWLAKEAGAETPRYVPATLADRSVGLHIVNAVCAALYRREKSGVGQRVDVPMFESLLQTVMGEHMGGYTFMSRDPGYARMLKSAAIAKDARLRRSTMTSSGAFFDLIGWPELFADPPTRHRGATDFEGANAWSQRRCATAARGGGRGLKGPTPLCSA
jgi:crotonobetainyl-CoA:carnitine CoA-transferase CaiB-like acyl-CoA transferase